MKNPRTIQHTHTVSCYGRLALVNTQQNVEVLCKHSQPGLINLSCVYKWRVEIKHEEFNELFSFHPYFWGERILQSTRRAFTTRVELFTCIFRLFSTRIEISTRPLNWDFNPGRHVNAWLLISTCRVVQEDYRPYLKLLMVIVPETVLLVCPCTGTALYCYHRSLWSHVKS